MGSVAYQLMVRLRDAEDADESVIRFMAVLLRPRGVTSLRGRLAAESAGRRVRW